MTGYFWNNQTMLEEYFQVECMVGNDNVEAWLNERPE